MTFIDQQRPHYRVESICAALTELGCQIAPRTYRSWKTRAVAGRTVTDAIITDRLRDTIGEHEGLYGRRKMVAHLRREGLAVAECTVDRLMRDEGLSGILRGRVHRTTIPAKDGVRAGDQLNRDFTAEAPNQRWVADFTYCRTWSGFVYVAFVIDCYSRAIVGWHASTDMTTPLVTAALRMALWRRDHTGHPVGDGLVHHSDAGSQGGVNWWSQHPVIAEVCGGATSAGFGSGVAPGDAFAGAAGPGQARAARVLAADRRG